MFIVYKPIIILDAQVFTLKFVGICKQSCFKLACKI